MLETFTFNSFHNIISVNIKLHLIQSHTPLRIYRYEIREDRKRETVRATGSMESLKRDIIRSIRSLSVGTPIASPSFGRSSASVHSSPLHMHSDMPMAMDPADMDYLKSELVSSLRTEMRNMATEMMNVSQEMSDAAKHNLPQPINSELYHTHLYTQL